MHTTTHTQTNTYTTFTCPENTETQDIKKKSEQDDYSVTLINTILNLTYLVFALLVGQNKTLMT